VNDSPVDCQSRERPSRAVRGANQVLSPAPKNGKFRQKIAVFYSSRRLGMESRVSVHGIAVGVWHHQRCIFCGLIPYDCFLVNSMPQQVADSIYGLRRDFNRERARPSLFLWCAFRAFFHLFKSLKINQNKSKFC